MKSKIFNLLSLSILALVMFMSFASAAILTISNHNIPTSVNQNAGSFDITFDLENAGVETDLDWSNSAATEGTITSFSFSHDYINASENLSIIATISFPNGQTGDISGIINAGVVNGSGDDKNFTFSVSITVEPEDITECSLLGEQGSELKIKIKDISITGFGDDEEWLPLDKIEVEVKVENDGDDDIDDIAIEWGLYDLESGDWYVDDEESDFNLKDGDDKVLTFSFNLDDNIDELENGNYVLYVWANAEVDNDTKTEVCISDSEVIEIIIENDFVILYDIESPETVSCGADFQITADVWNIGDSDQDDVSVKVYNSELGINELVTIGDIDEFDSEFLDVFVEIPKDAEEKSYLIRFTVYDEDNEVYENDFDEDESVFTIPLKVEGNCKIDVTAVVSASLESGGKAGEELIIKSIITNSGDKSATYTVNVAGYASWASLDNIDQSTFTLDDGESKEIFITFNVDKDASGDKTFNIEVLSENQLIATQPVSVSIEKSAFSLTDNITENSWLWGIGLLNLILIIAIIVVAVKLARK